MKIVFLSTALVLTIISVEAQLAADSIRIDQNYRSFYFEKPAGGSAQTLVFVLHGSGGNGQNMAAATPKLSEKARTENVLLVYPNGYKRYWNECRKAASSLANQENVDESAFFSGMIEYFAEKYKIDKQRVFAMGTSGGGHMCYKLALTMPEKFRGVAAFIANLPDDENMDCPESGKPIPVMIVNGTADPINPYEGGMMKGGNFIMGTVRSTDQSLRYWSQLAGYKGEPVKESVPDNDPNDGKTIERYTFKSKGKPEVTLLKVIGGKHDYPNDIDIHVEALEFFKRQAKQ
jgi:polyhydroxybutyrate depolymerase